MAKELKLTIEEFNMEYQTVVAGILRHILTSLGGASVASGILLTGNTIEVVVGSLFTLGGFVWSIVSKKK